MLEFGGDVRDYKLPHKMCTACWQTAAAVAADAAAVAVANVHLIKQPYSSLLNTYILIQ
jgi:hypothetical protein